MDKILFLCSGNTCRSPFAEVYFNNIAKNNNINAVANSAGIFANIDDTPGENAKIAAKDFGLDIEMSIHRAKILTPEMLGEYDYIITMGSSHLDIIEKAIQNGVYTKPEQRRQVLAGGIPDPYGSSILDYKNCYALISNAVNAFIEANY